MKRRLRRPSRKNGVGGSANTPNAPQDLHDAGVSSQHTTAALHERPKPQASADRSSSAFPTPNLSAASRPSLPSSSTSASCAAGTSIPQNVQHRTLQDGPSSGANASKKDYWQLAVDQLQEEDSSIADQIAAVKQAAAAAGNADFTAQLLYTTGCLVAMSRDDQVLWRQHGRQLQPHIQALTAWDISKLFASQPAIKIICIIMKCGWLLYDMRDDAKLFVLMHSLLTHPGLDRQTVDRRWLEVYELTAWNLINYGKIKEAVSLLEQVVQIREQTLAEDHPDRLASKNNLATMYWDLGRRSAGLQMMKHVVEIRRQVLDEHHPAREGSEAWLARGKPVIPSL